MLFVGVGIGIGIVPEPIRLSVRRRLRKNGGLVAILRVFEGVGSGLAISVGSAHLGVFVILVSFVAVVAAEAVGLGRTRWIPPGGRLICGANRAGLEVLDVLLNLTPQEVTVVEVQRLAKRNHRSSSTARCCEGLTAACMRARRVRSEADGLVGVVEGGIGLPFLKVSR